MPIQFRDIFGEFFQALGLLGVLAPSGDLTGAADSTAIANALGSFKSILLRPGQWYLSAPIQPGAGQVVSGGGPGTVLNQGSAWAGTGLFKPTGSNMRITSLAAAPTTASFIDFANVFMNYFECDHVQVTTQLAASPDIFTNANLHRSNFHDCLFTQVSGISGIWTMGSTGTGLSTTSFTRNVSIVQPDPNTGVRTVPGWKIYLATNKTVDVVRFTDCFFLQAQAGGHLDSTRYMVDIACTANAANSDFDRLLFRNCDFGACLGGAVRILSATGIELDSVTCGNMFAAGGSSLGNSIIAVGTSGASAPSAGVTITNYQREGSTALGSGADPSDISISADTTSVTIINPNVPDSAAGPQININGAAGCLVTGVLGAQNNATVLNPAADTIVLGNQGRQTLVFANSWAQSAGRPALICQFAQVPPSEVEVMGSVVVPIGFASGQAITTGSPAAYHPANIWSLTGWDTTTNLPVRLIWDNNGILKFFGPVANTAVGNTIDIPLQRVHLTD